MKKIYLSFCALVLLSGLHAQSNAQLAPLSKTSTAHKTLGGKMIETPVMRNKATFFSNDFSNGANWTIGNESGNSDNWLIGTTAPSGSFSIDPIASTTAANGFALFDSDLLCSGEQAAWVQLTAPINCSGHLAVAIEFEQFFRAWQAQTFVQVSTDGTTWTDFEVNVGLSNNTFTANPELLSVDISSVASNQTSVYVRFYYVSGSLNGGDGCGYAWMVDDVALRDLDNFDLTVNSGYWGSTGAWGSRLPYSMVPISQVTAIDIAASTTNNGAMDQADAALTVSIPEALFSSTGPQIYIPSGTTDTLDLSTAFTPSISIMTYNPSLSVNSSNMDSSPGDNVLLATPISVNDSVYARDMLVDDGGSFNSGQGFEVGNIFDIYADGTVKTATVKISATANVGAQAYVRLYSIDTGTGDFVFLEESGLYTIANGDLDNFITLPFQSNVSLLANTAYLLVAGSYGDGGATNDLVVSTSGLSETQTTFYFDMTDQTWYYTNSTPMVRLNINPTIPIIASSDLDNNICTGDTITLTSTVPSGNVWSTGEITQSISVTSAGTYTVTAMIGGVPETSLVTTITETTPPPMPTISAGGSTTICPNGSVVLTSSSPSGNTWSTGETSASITVVSGGSYSVTVSASGCSTSSAATPVMMANNPSISLGTTTNPTVCGASDGSIEITGTGGMGNVTWTGTASGSAMGVSLPTIISTFGQGTYTLTFDDGCTSNTVTTLLNDPGVIPTITPSGSTTFCDGSSVDLTSSSATGNVWSPNGETTQTITVSSGGNYSVTVTSGGCVTTSSTETLTVNAIPTAPSIVAGGPITFCEGGSVDLVSSSGFSPMWSDGQTTQVITVTSSGTYTVTATIGGCVSLPSAPISVTENVLPTVTLGTFNAICNTGSSFILNQGAPAGGNYMVNGTAAANFNPATANIGTNNVIFYTFTDGNGCTNSATQNITVNDCSGIDEHTVNLFQVYPNPSSSIVHIEGALLHEITSIELCDEIGRVMQTVMVNSNEVNLDVSNFSSGYYTLRMNGTTFTEIQKIQVIN